MLADKIMSGGWAPRHSPSTPSLRSREQVRQHGFSTNRCPPSHNTGALPLRAVRGQPRLVQVRLDPAAQLLTCSRARRVVGIQRVGLLHGAQRPSANSGSMAGNSSDGSRVRALMRSARSA